MRNKITFELLNDYLDGELSSEDESALVVLLEQDKNAQAELDGLRTLRAATSALPTELTPDRDLWAGIQEDVTREPVQGNVYPFARRMKALLHRPVGLAAAALLLIIPAFHLLHYFQDSTPVTPPSSRVADLSLEFERSERVYSQARKDVLASLRGDDTPVSKETLAAIEESLSDIDQAVSDIQSALLESPDDHRLVKLLTSTREKERSLLRQLGELARRV